MILLAPIIFFILLFAVYFNKLEWTSSLAFKLLFGISACYFSSMLNLEFRAIFWILAVVLIRYKSDADEFSTLPFSAAILLVLYFNNSLNVSFVFLLGSLATFCLFNSRERQKSLYLIFIVFSSLVSFLSESILSDWYFAIVLGLCVFNILVVLALKLATRISLVYLGSLFFTILALSAGRGFLEWFGDEHRLTLVVIFGLYVVIETLRPERKNLEMAMMATLPFFMLFFSSNMSLMGSYFLATLFVNHLLELKRDEKASKVIFCLVVPGLFLALSIIEQSFSSSELFKLIPLVTFLPVLISSNISTCQVDCEHGIDFAWVYGIASLCLSFSLALGRF